MKQWGSAFTIDTIFVTSLKLSLFFMVLGISSLIVMPLIGKLSAKVNKFKIFTMAALWMIVMIVVYTHLTPVALPIVLIMKVAFMIGIMSRMVPAMALTTSLPKMQVGVRI